MSKAAKMQNKLDIEQAWWAQSFQRLRRRSTALLVISISAAAGQVFVLWSMYEPSLLLLWLCSLAVASGAQKFWLHQAHCPASSGLIPDRRWLYAWLAMVLLQGGLWGATALLLPAPDGLPASTKVKIILLLGCALLTAGICLVPLIFSYLLFLLAALLPAAGSGPTVLTAIAGIFALGLALLLWSIYTQFQEFRMHLKNYRQTIKEELSNYHKKNELLQQNIQEVEDRAAELTSLTIKDPLTQIANRRHFDDFLKREWQRGMRSKQPLSLIMIDIDHFKRYNDGYGHQAGDHCLHKVARALQVFSRRPSDLAARYGGEEFALILPETPEQAAYNMGERLCREIEKLGLKNEKSRAGLVTISTGIATLVPGKKYHRAQLIRMADEALYQAKSSGRNQACQASQPPPDANKQ